MNKQRVEDSRLGWEVLSWAGAQGAMSVNSLVLVDEWRVKDSGLGWQALRWYRRRYVQVQRCL